MADYTLTYILVFGTMCALCLLGFCTWCINKCRDGDYSSSDYSCVSTTRYNNEPTYQSSYPQNEPITCSYRPARCEYEFTTYPQYGSTRGRDGGYYTPNWV